jgi:hypothetical protein
MQSAIGASRVEPCIGDLSAPETDPAKTWFAVMYFFALHTFSFSKSSRDISVEIQIYSAPQPPV